MIRGGASGSLARARAVLVDLSGTLHVEDTVLPGAVEALDRLRSSGLKIRFITNTTKESKQSLLSRLLSLKFTVSSDEIFTSLTATRKLVEKEKLNPLLLLEELALEDFQGIGAELTQNLEGDHEKEFDSVVVGLAPSKFNYKTLNHAFRVLLNGGRLIAVHKSPYFKDKDGLSLGPGAFVAALETASRTEAIAVGKPQSAFYQAVLADIACSAEETIMIGDDVIADIEGALKCGMMAVLVKTGKYREKDEERISLLPTAVCDNFSAVVDLILSLKSSTN